MLNYFITILLIYFFTPLIESRFIGQGTQKTRLGSSAYILDF